MLLLLHVLQPTILLFFLSLLQLHPTAALLPLIHLSSHQNNTISFENHNDLPGAPTFVFSSNSTTQPTTICFAIVLDQSTAPPTNISAHSHLGCVSTSTVDRVTVALQPTTANTFTDLTSQNHYHHYHMYSWLKNYAQEKLYYAITLNSCCSAIIRRVVAATSVHTPWALGRTDIWEEYPECARVCPVSDTNSAGSHQGWHSTLKPTNHPPIDRFAAHYAGRALLGAPAASVGIGYGDLLLLGLALNVNPMSSNHFVELGTYKGTTSLYLGMAARMRLGKHGKGHGRLDTFDIADLRSESVRHAWLPEMFLHVIDIEGELLHANGFHPHPLVVDKVQQASLLFIDGGLKR